MNQTSTVPNAISFCSRNDAWAPSTSQVLQCSEAARRGLDFLVRHQVKDVATADRGRFPFIYNTKSGEIQCLTTNWTTGVGVSAMLSGYQFFGDDRYFDSAKLAVGYLYSLQDFSPTSALTQGAFHEETPQTPVFHPRDALTAAWATLDFGLIAGEAEAIERATLYADWFVKYAMDGDYPRWTVGFGEQSKFAVLPRWYGSFHSGSAFFMARMHALTGKQDSPYLQAMEKILTLYNRLLLDSSGRVHVIADIERQEILQDSEVCDRIAPEGWIRMHEYNDDFGALANLQAWRITGKAEYRDAAERFLGHMLLIQREDGGFGPGDSGQSAGFSVPPAGGSIMLELLSAQECGFRLADNGAIDSLLKYIVGLQFFSDKGASDGAFRGYNEQYTQLPHIANIRSGGYAILALLRTAGATNGVYSLFEKSPPELP